MSVDERRALLKGDGQCFNCLNNNHSVYNCKSRFRCRQYNRKHHSLVHENQTTNTQLVGPHHHHHCGKCIITALFYVADSETQPQLCRVLLDSGSQGSFISERCTKKLRLKRTTANLAISGIGGSTNGYTKGIVSLIITPWNETKPCVQITAYVFPKLTTRQPSIFKFIDISYFEQYNLADPYFHKGPEIDIIIGSDSFFELLSDGKVITPYKLILQNTQLGWVVTGKSAESHSKQSLTIALDDQNDNLEISLRKFWEIESIDSHVSNLSEDERFCEKHFQSTTTINEDGRFQVRLPFKLHPTNLENSFPTAIQRMHSMDRRFSKNPEFAALYKDFMSEYLRLGHMKPSHENQHNGYYLPHHGVVKISSATSKLRVVFDGSAKTSSGNSLNDYLAVGSNVQSILYEVLLRFRLFKIAFIADVEKMYRQVWVAADDTKYQQIIWRDTSDKPFTTYNLQTVTYGTASASYLATRALNEATEHYKTTFQEATNHIKTQMYVDYLMTGADTLVDAKRLKKKINLILTKYITGFHLRKWLTNDKKMLINNVQHPAETNLLEIDEPDSTKSGLSDSPSSS